MILSKEQAWSRTDKNVLCLLDNCMAWRWFDECAPVDCDDCTHWELIGNERKCVRRGYCGLAGMPKFS